MADRAHRTARLLRVSIVPLAVTSLAGYACWAGALLLYDASGGLGPLAPIGDWPIDAAAYRFFPALGLFGCGTLSAAKLFAETAGIGRFRSRAAFAAHTGTAPIPVWSGNLLRHRLNRDGNRQLNAALHRIAITQLRGPGLGQAYVAKRMAAGDTKTEAIRALRRRLSDEVFRRLQTDEAARAGIEPLTRAAA